MEFEDLRLTEPLLRAVRTEGYTRPTPIQVEAIPHLLEGKDLLGCAQTGTGKTAAFALPILQRLASVSHTDPGRRPIRALILTPTRELAAQIHQSFLTYGQFLRKLQHTVVHGGVSQRPQVRALKKGVDILVATPGRLLDLMGQKIIKLDRVEVLVLDEADRMLDMGFIPDVQRIVSCVRGPRQTLLFSATMPASVQSLADSLLSDPVEVRVAPERPAAEGVEHWVYFVERMDKLALLQTILADAGFRRALIFMRTKRGADRITRHLKYNSVRAEAIHSDRSQKEREHALANFKDGRTRVLVASDIAARGLDVEDVSHVINFDMPDDPEMYVHRIGRTGRAGALGKALSFCALEERTSLEQIERLIGQPLQPIEDHAFHSTWGRPSAEKPSPPKRGLMRRKLRAPRRRRIRR